MRPYKSFIFSDYSFDAVAKKATLHYGLDDKIHFKEVFTFDFSYASYDEAALDRALQNLFFMAGVSYFKTFIPEDIAISSGSLDQQDAAFFSTVYQKGLGEFFYTNKLDVQTPIPFQPNTRSTTTAPQETNTPQPSGQLIAIGGGKDSIVTAELLKDQPGAATWSLDHQAQLEPLVERIGLEHFWVQRQIDPKLKELNTQGALNGHIPISAIFACVGTVVAILSGKSDVVVSNEQSANEPNLTVDGRPINHQYSKSQAFEESYQKLLQKHFGKSQRYYSFLRPLSELHIVELFVKKGFLAKYLGVFSSCNKAFTQASGKLFWCGACPKCAFAYLAMTPFVDASVLESIFQKNVLNDPGLEHTYKELLGVQGNKPLECVGEIKEAQSALRLASKSNHNVGTLTSMQTPLPEGYDYKKIYPDSMPDEVRQLLLNAI